MIDCLIGMAVGSVVTLGVMALLRANREDKSIPMTPYNTEEYSDTVIGKCPNCKHYVNSGENYCSECGQRLDWRQ